MLPVLVPCIHVDFCVSRCSALRSYRMLFVCWEGDCLGEPWNVICLMVG